MNPKGSCWLGKFCFQGIDWDKLYLICVLCIYLKRANQCNPHTDLTILQILNQRGCYLIITRRWSLGFLISFVTRIGRGIFRIAVRERLFLVQNIFSNDASNEAARRVVMCFTFLTLAARQKQERLAQWAQMSSRKVNNSNKKKLSGGWGKSILDWYFPVILRVKWGNTYWNSMA